MNIYEYMSVGENEKPLDRIVTDGGFCAIFRTIACIGDSLSSGELESVKEDGAKTFIGYYAQIIQRIKLLQPCAKIFLVSPPQNGNLENERTQKYKIVRDLLQELTTVFSRTYLLDMFEYAPIQNKAFMETYWHGHMSPTGYVLAARMIESYIDYIIRKNPKDFKQVGFIGTDLYYESEGGESK